ncbi:MAG: hypothetical protein EP341_04530 [Sphingomonadales bacterium]|nr:MAG: hypothetical protein EP341_04530 [Sphingomonadales bacterium]
MSLDPAAILCAGLAITMLLYSGYWTDRTYARFERIPGHYDFHGNATRLTPRRQMAWLIPVIFSVILAVFTVLFELIPADMQNGDPSIGLVFSSVVLVSAQGLILWLLSRWARSQDQN